MVTQYALNDNDNVKHRIQDNQTTNYDKMVNYVKDVSWQNYRSLIQCTAMVVVKQSYRWGGGAVWRLTFLLLYFIFNNCFHFFRFRLNFILITCWWFFIWNIEQ
jgi:hypothetical protein